LCQCGPFSFPLPSSWRPADCLTSEGFTRPYRQTRTSARLSTTPIGECAYLPASFLAFSRFFFRLLESPFSATSEYGCPPCNPNRGFFPILVQVLLFDNKPEEGPCFGFFSHLCFLGSITLSGKIFPAKKLACSLNKVIGSSKPVPRMPFPIAACFAFGSAPPLFFSSTPRLKDCLPTTLDRFFFINVEALIPPLRFFFALGVKFNFGCSRSARFLTLSFSLPVSHAYPRYGENDGSLTRTRNPFSSRFVPCLRCKDSPLPPLLQDRATRTRRQNLATAAFSCHVIPFPDCPFFILVSTPLHSSVTESSGPVASTFDTPWLFWLEVSPLRASPSKVFFFFFLRTRTLPPFKSAI